MSNHIHVPSETLGDLAVANRILANQKVLDAFGHVSVRHPNDPNRFLMTRSLAPALVSKDDIMEFTLDCKPVDQRGRAMLAERAIHGCIYEARLDVNAVCHNHTYALIPFGVTRTQLRPVFHLAAGIGAKVPIWDIRDEFGDTDLLVTSNETGASLARALGQRSVVLMRGHGATVAGRTLRETVFTAIFLKVNAELLLAARGLGEVQFLSDGEIEAMTNSTVGPLALERAWNAWVTEVRNMGM